MDLLEALDIPSLPEQQTRLSHHNVNKVLSVNPDARLGFDVCCYCAQDLSSVDSDKNDPLRPAGICCKRCKKVRYCSEQCRKNDSDPSLTHNVDDEQEDEEEKENNLMMMEAGGHSPIVCSLLRLCAIDEDVEAELETQKADGTNGKKSKLRHPHNHYYDSKNNNHLQKQKEREAAQQRISSELESYPATLGHILKDGPCFQVPLRKRQIDQDKACYTPCSSLTVHIVGSSLGAELWPRDDEILEEDAQCDSAPGSYSPCPRSPVITNAEPDKPTGSRGAGILPFTQAYTQALAETLIDKHTSLKLIRLVFIGPDCPRISPKVCRVTRHNHSPSCQEVDEDTTGVADHGLGPPPGKRKRVGSCDRAFNRNNSNNCIKPGNTTPKVCHVPPPRHEPNKECRVSFETCSMTYDTFMAKKKKKLEGSKPDVVVFFNPGLTCPDYVWEKSMSCVPSGTPFLVTTNTEMEALADCQYLYEHKFIAALPRTAAEIINGDMGSDDGQSDEEEKNAIKESYDLATRQMMFFGENPYCGSRVRQSGNMANDLFVKNRWMFGGIFGQELKNEEEEKSPLSLPLCTIVKEGTCQRYMVKGKGNRKRDNPALI